MNYEIKIMSDEILRSPFFLSRLTSTSKIDLKNPSNSKWDPYSGLNGANLLTQLQSHSNNKSKRSNRIFKIQKKKKFHNFLGGKILYFNLLSFLKSKEAFQSYWIWNVFFSGFSWTFLWILRRHKERQIMFGCVFFYESVGGLESYFLLSTWIY
jgi:hypothetical protein